MPIKILRPSLDDFNQTTVLRGLIDRSTIGEIKFDFYQREKLSAAARRDIHYALATGAQLPDVELGMRGDKFQVDDDGSIILIDPCYAIDGRQRIETLKEYMDEHPDTGTHLGAVTHFNTNALWERERFHLLNTSRVKVAPNILLRNIKDDCPGLATLYGLSQHTPEFPLFRRVCWTQSIGRDELISAMGYVRVALRLHAHLAPTRTAISGASAAPFIGRVVERVGLPMLRANVKAFWELIDELWGIKSIKLKSHTSYLLTSFLQVFADILSDHVDFWRQPDEIKLVVPYELKVKLRKFPVADPEVVRLAGASGKAQETLYFIIISHINSGKRTRRLVPRNARATIPPIIEDGDDEEEDAA